MGDNKSFKYLVLKFHCVTLSCFFITNNSGNIQVTSTIYTNDKSLYVIDYQKLLLIVFEYVYIKIELKFSIFKYWIYSEYSFKKNLSRLKTFDQELTKVWICFSPSIYQDEVFVVGFYGCRKGGFKWVLNVFQMFSLNIESNHVKPSKEMYNLIHPLLYKPLISLEK